MRRPQIEAFGEEEAEASPFAQPPYGQKVDGDSRPASAIGSERPDSAPPPTAASTYRSVWEAVVAQNVSMRGGAHAAADVRGGGGSGAEPE